MISGLAGDRVILYSAHVPSDLEAVAERVLLLRSGRSLG